VTGRGGGFDFRQFFLDIAAGAITFMPSLPVPAGLDWKENAMNNWEKPRFEEVDLRGECTAYAGGDREGGSAANRKPSPVAMPAVSPSGGSEENAVPGRRGCP
jgi:hypothetical protein